MVGSVMWPFPRGTRLNRDYGVAMAKRASKISRHQDNSPPAYADHVDAVRAQWTRVRPDLDTEPLAVVGRLGRAVGHLDRHLADFFARYGLTRAHWDVLAALRRSGPPYRLSPTVLY